jgi:hypothetical protein
MNKKLQDKKKKQREKLAKGKVLRRREAMRKKAKYDARIESDVASTREPVMPIINKFKEKERKQKALAHNMEILKKLEEEYKKEQESRRQLNKSLESQGHQTLQEKVAAMGEAATKAAGGYSLIEKTQKTLADLQTINSTEFATNCFISPPEEKEQN